MAPQVNRIDLEAINALDAELVSLAQGIRLTWQPAAERLGCDRLLGELEAATASDSPGTLRSVARAVGRCPAVYVSEVILRKINGRFDLRMRGRNGGELLAEVLEEFPSAEEVTITIKRNSEGFRRTVAGATGEVAKALIDSGAFAPGGVLSTSPGQQAALPQPAQQALPSREWRLPTHCTVCDAPVDEYGFCTNRRCRTPHVAGWHRALPPGGDTR